MLGERVRMIREEAGLSREAFSARIGYKTGGAIQLVERDMRGLSTTALRELCRQFSVNEEWLLTGNGEMHRDLSPANEAAERVRRLLVDAPASTAGAVIAALVELDPLGPEWAVIGSVLRSISAKLEKPTE